jgi:Tol biopolymer transport system component
VLNLCKKDTNGTGGEEQLLDPSPFGRTPTDWSRDGRFVIFTVINPETARDIWVLPMAGDRKPFAFLHTWADELYGRLSPDGRWLAYLSNEGYTGDVYVRSFSGTPNEQAANVRFPPAEPVSRSGAAMGGSYSMFRNKTGRSAR